MIPKRVLVLGGTSETRDIVLALNKHDHQVVVCTVTHWDLSLPAHVLRIVGALSFNRLVQIIEKLQIQALIDVTHPFASQISQLAKQVSKRVGVPLFGYQRPEWIPKGKNVILVQTHLQAEQTLLDLQKTTLFTIGVKNLSYYKRFFGSNIPFWIKILPQSLSRALNSGLKKHHLLLLPAKLPCAKWSCLIEKYNIQVMLAKSSGIRGGLKEKFRIASQYNLDFVLIRRPKSYTENYFQDLNELAKAVIAYLENFDRNIYMV
ncbi:MAG: precorrin-6A reductase [Desulfonauticus sp.]|nr:precorrin-6A reductase [Desulfonauticus sp.]